MKFFAVVLALAASALAATECKCQDAITVSCIENGIQTFPYSCETPKNNFKGKCEGVSPNAHCNPPAF